MTSFRKIIGGTLSAAPGQEPKRASGSRGAVRHGLTAETVIDGLEDSEDYRAFEAAVIADYDAGTAVERELVLRLIISIETDLLSRTSSANVEPHLADGTSNQRKIRVRARDRHLLSSIRSGKTSRTVNMRHRVAAHHRCRSEI
jgi:hypothetical protein